MDKLKKNKNSLNSYARYSNIGMQMLVIIIAGVWGGVELDKWLNTTPVLTVVLSLLSVSLAIYSVVKNLLK
jgi:F0F1-type ATP synthase assembly protein I